MPNFIGGNPLGPPEYVETPPTPQESPLPGSTFTQFPDASLPTNFLWPTQPRGALLACGMSVAYVRDRGLRCAAVARPPGTGPAFWRTHGGMAWKVVTGVFQSLIGTPTLPTAYSNDNEVLLSTVLGIPSNFVGGDGNVVYYRTVQYFFVLQQPPADSDPLYGCVIQLDTTSLSANVVNPADYVSNLLGPIPNPAQFSGGPISF